MHSRPHDRPHQDARKLCSSLRRNSRDERILFHYTGHGVPRPTANGEIWVFNKNYTQYIPLSIYDLQTWMGSPSIFVYDCSGAGHIVNAFHQFGERREREYEKALVRCVCAHARKVAARAGHRSSLTRKRQRIPRAQGSHLSVTPKAPTWTRRHCRCSRCG